MNVSYIFPGQGSQIIGMGEDFYNFSQKAKDMFLEASEILKIDMKKLLFEKNDKLDQTEFSQPAILLISAIAHELLGDKFSPTYALGHSLGEISALVSVNALNYLDGVKLVHERGLLMKKACENKNVAMMAVIGLDYETLSNLCIEFQKQNQQVWLANINNQSQIVLAGIKEDLIQIEAILKQNGAKRAIMLPMSVASHCPLLQNATEPFKVLLDLHVKDNFLAPIISNVTAKPYDNKKEACELLKNQLINPVQYVKCIEFAQNNSDIFIEFGGSVLKGLNKKITQKPTFSITDIKSLEEVSTL